MQTTLRAAFSLLVMLCGLNMSSAKDANDLQNLGVGHVHMDISCSPAASRNFDMALALLHNFWYPRALSTFDQVIQADPECGHWCIFVLASFHLILGLEGLGSLWHC